MALITGNTYPVRDQLKALGGLWQPALKGWQVPEAQAEQARQLVAQASPAPADRLTRRAYAPRTCQQCGGGIRYGVYCGKCEFGR
jgi:xanthine/CO dehydrogenase XdhC/CoxF family maturation factor